MIDLSSALASIENFYRRIYWYADEAITVEGDGYTLSYSGVPWMHSINQLWLHQPNIMDESLLHLASQFFRRYHADYSLVFSEAQPSPLRFWLAERFYIERAATPIYALEGLPRPAFMHRDLTIVQACIGHQQTLLDILNRTFFMGTEAGRCVVRDEHFRDSSIRHYLGYVDGESAACATLMLSQGIAGVWNVGTLRPYRRRGVAAAVLMRALVEAAADGFPNSVLLASPMGKPLYEGMGYRFVATTYFFGPLE
jgi:GNAT superfamily N-acetyltransferase